MTVIDMRDRFAAMQAESEELKGLLRGSDQRAAEIDRLVRRLKRQGHPLEAITWDLSAWSDMLSEDLAKQQK